MLIEWAVVVLSWFLCSGSLVVGVGLAANLRKDPKWRRWYGLVVLLTISIAATIYPGLCVRFAGLVGLPYVAPAWLAYIVGVVSFWAMIRAGVMRYAMAIVWPWERRGPAAKKAGGRRKMYKFET